MATRLATGCWWLDLGGVNAYCYEDGDDLVLVDAGMPWDAGDLRAGLADAGFDVPAVDRVLLTHYDLDHVGALARLTPDLDAPVLAAEPDRSYAAGEAKPPWRNHKGALQRATRFLLDVPDLPFEAVADGDEVGRFTAFHTPGHTPGHVVYVDRAGGVAFLGDLVRAEDGALSPSPWFISYDAGEVAESVRSLADRAPAFDVACPGHGDPLGDGGADALAALVE